MRLYLDASAVIYALEGPSGFREAALAWIRQARGSPGGSLITSRLSRIECRSKPLGRGDEALLSTYDRFFGICTVAAIDDEIVDRATELRGRFGLRTPDAIHLATAIMAQADRCLTGDRDMARCDEIEVVVLSP
jgi:predicted nucleic acid-binding protein